MLLRAALDFIQVLEEDVCVFDAILGALENVPCYLGGSLRLHFVIAKEDNYIMVLMVNSFHDLLLIQVRVVLLLVDDGHFEELWDRIFEHELVV